ncbi:MAG: hypothetical protein JW889_10235 [Verrucomicrobia bacterium]|nr:hypothetical protein [Verrucomicrobiota bacterium]
MLMLHLLTRVVSSIGALVTAASVLATVKVPTVAEILLWLLMAIALVAAMWDIANYLRRRPSSFAPNSPAIATYLAGWLRSGGRAAIFSRDLSWAKEDHVRRILDGKAADGALLVFAGRTTPEILRLANTGAEVYDYARLQFSPRSRFTFLDYGKAGARLAIGIVRNGQHSITEYGPSDEVVMSLAGDLVELARRSARKVTCENVT